MRNFLGWKTRHLQRLSPTALDIPVDRLYTSHRIEDALGRLVYAADRQMFAVVTASPGRGKSTLARMFEGRLGRLDRAETGKYIAAHLAYSGTQQGIFTEGAETEVYKISTGIPRLINRVCEKALLYACQQQKRLVDEHMVRFVADHERLVGGVE